MQTLLGLYSTSEVSLFVIHFLSYLPFILELAHPTSNNLDNLDNFDNVDSSISTMSDVNKLVAILAPEGSGIPQLRYSSLSAFFRTYVRIRDRDPDCPIFFVHGIDINSYRLKPYC